MSVQIGIGSWADKEYVGVLYPKELRDKERLRVYADYFGHVELNATSHAIPPRERIAGWEKLTPAGFIFDVKLHQDFSRDPAGATRRGLVTPFLNSMQPIIAANKLGVILLVLEAGFCPPRHQLAELDPLIEELKPHTLAVELRNNAWVDEAQRERTLGFFRERRLVWVAVDMPQIKNSPIMPAVDEVTNPQLGYLRLHGRNPNWFQAKSKERHDYFYSAGELEEIVGRIQKLAAKAANVRVVANNHFKDFAPRTALALKGIFKQPLPKAEGRQEELF
jgi:uncharacterized protein YecE (DUF72 family)